MLLIVFGIVVQFALYLSLLLIIPISVSVITCYKKQRKEAFGRQQSTDVPMTSMYFVPGLNYGSSDSADSHQQERFHKSRLRRNNTKQLNQFREPSMNDADLFDQRQTTLPPVTTINTTTMADHDKVLTFEQSHTDVGPELNLVEDVVEQRKNLSNEPIVNEKEEESDGKKQQSEMPSISDWLKASPSAPPPPSNKEAVEEKRTSPKRKCRGVRMFLKGKGREGSRDDKLSSDSPYKRMKSSNITDGAFY